MHCNSLFRNKPKYKEGRSRYITDLEFLITCCSLCQNLFLTISYKLLGHSADLSKQTTVFEINLAQFSAIGPHDSLIFVSVRNGEITLDQNLPNLGECIAYNTMSNVWTPLDCNQQKKFTCDASTYCYN